MFEFSYIDSPTLKENTDKVLALVAQRAAIPKKGWKNRKERRRLTKAIEDACEYQRFLLERPYVVQSLDSIRRKLDQFDAEMEQYR